MFSSPDYRNRPLSTYEHGIVSRCVDTILVYRADGRLAARDADDVLCEFFAKPWVPIEYYDLRGYIANALRSRIGNVGD